MKKLAAPHWNPIEDFDEIIKHKEPSRRARLCRLRETLDSCYHSYESTLIDTSNAGKLDHADAQDIEQCYDSKTAGFKALKKKIDKLYDIDICPYCDIHATTTLDHHLPKREFPEFYICAYNLVRACHSCQNDERPTKKWRDDRGRRLLLHPYYDPIDDQGPLFVARIDVSARLPSVDYTLNEEIGRSVAWFPQLSTHWNTLDLKRRYSNAAGGQMGSLINQVRSYSRSLDLHKAQRGLRDYAERERRDWGQNHWRVALLAAAADDVGFIRYALRGMSP